MFALKLDVKPVFRSLQRLRNGNYTHNLRAVNCHDQPNINSSTPILVFAFIELIQ